MGHVKSAVAAALLFLAACALPMTPQQEAFLHGLADRPVTCHAGDDCEEKWSRAIEWVDKHSVSKIKTVSDNLIETHKVYMGNPRENMGYPEFTVVRYAKGKYNFVMHFSSYCDSGLACNPSGLKLRADFVTFVMGPPPGVTVSPDGAGATKTLQPQGE